MRTEHVNHTPSEEEIARLEEKLEEYMRENGLRSTVQRRLVTSVFFRSEGHLSIDDLLSRVREDEPSIGYATVYRTLKLLRESGLANERHFGDGVSRYEVAHEDEHHDHLICVDCDRIIEFENEEIEALQEALVAKKGFTIRRHIHELYVVGQRDKNGACAYCGEQRHSDSAQP